VIEAYCTSAKTRYTVNSGMWSLLIYYVQDMCCENSTLKICNSKSQEEPCLTDRLFTVSDIFILRTFKFRITMWISLKLYILWTVLNFFTFIQLKVCVIYLLWIRVYLFLTTTLLPEIIQGRQYGIQNK
jgi:hypothetical protein